MKNKLLLFDNARSHIANKVLESIKITSQLAGRILSLQTRSSRAAKLSWISASPILLLLSSTSMVRRWVGPWAAAPLRRSSI